MSEAQQFIILLHEDDAMTKKRQRRITRSHAARTANERTRRLNLLGYQSRIDRWADTSLGHMCGSSHKQQRSSPTVRGPLSAARSDPFSCFSRPFRPLEHFLLDHYVTVVVPLMRCHETASHFQERMNTAWIPLALTDIGLTVSLFLSACRHLSSAYHEPRFMQLAIQYKLQCVQTLREVLDTGASLTDATIGKAVMLAYDELSLGDTAMSQRHVNGALQMVQLRGGSWTLGINGFLEHLLTNLQTKFADGSPSLHLDLAKA